MEEGDSTEDGKGDGGNEEGEMVEAKDKGKQVNGMGQKKKSGGGKKGKSDGIDGESKATVSKRSPAAGYVKEGINKGQVRKEDKKKSKDERGKRGKEKS